MGKKKNILDAETDRRAFLAKAGGIAVPPAMVMLLSTTMSSPAIAASGAILRGGDSDSDLDGAPLLLAPLAAVPAAGAPAGAAAAPLLAAAPAAPAAGQFAAPVAGVLPSSSAGPVLAVAPAPGAPRKAGTLYSDSPRGRAIARAGERG